MCLAIPAKVTSIDGLMAQVEMAGVTRETSIMMLPETKVGDYVLIHAGFAIQRLDEEEALETLRLFEQIAGLAEEDNVAQENVAQEIGD